MYGHDERLRIVATVTSTKPEAASQWSHALIAQTLADMGISASQVGRILADLGIKPHLVRSWLTRPQDPEFRGRAAEVCGPCLSKPTNALVLSIDEKTAIPARSPRPTRPVAAGRPERREFEYRPRCPLRYGHRHRRTPQRRSQLCGVPRRARYQGPAGPAGSPDPRQRLLACGEGDEGLARRAPPVHRSPHAQARELVEPGGAVFSILSRRLLRRGEFDSREDLVAKIMAFIAEHNRSAKPFRWIYDGSPLKVA